MYQRGQRNFNSLFSDIPAQAPEADKKSGRNDDLNALRNEFLLNRYFYYGFYTDKRNQKILEAMSLEFFLSERRISDIVIENLNVLQELRKAPPTKETLREKYPHIVW